MRKTVLALILVLCFTLGACGKKTAAPSTSPSQVADPPPTPNIESALPSDPTPEPAVDVPSEPTTESYSYYPIFERIEKICVGDGYGDADTVFTLNDDERSALWLLMRVDDWVVATDLPIAGFVPEFYILEDEQAWFFNIYRGQILVVPSSPPPDGDKVCYFAPTDVLTDIMAYTETLVSTSE